MRSPWGVGAFDPVDLVADLFGRQQVRNRQMLEHEPDLVIAFPGGKGTADMIRVARKAGQKVVLAAGEAESDGDAPHFT